jgi:hypothetical protein
MVERRRISIAVVGVLVLGATIRADMMPVSRPESGYRQSLSLCDHAARPRTDLSSRIDCPVVADLYSLLAGSIPASCNEEGQACEVKPVPVVADAQESFTLGLCTLMGLGLYRSAPWVKRLSIGCLRDWYHEGGPHQIGHSYAVGPDVRPAPVVCFIQPERPAADSPAKYCLGTVVSLWRNLQFASSLFASRGPPLCSC